MFWIWRFFVPLQQQITVRMEKIIGREAELGKLADYFGSEKSEFIALYGRRRVGKTFLIRNFFKDQFDFYATGVIEGSRETEMEAFYNA